ncbi:formyltetrahydrofolate deformylase [Gracilibacillus boraciitolerans JCM 21714]|uniref:Formyltetrahydrofolate deformylase n=1 Tax=Gracilibacillus boraciitolerans JCM 21714 TaxID=1298598 RepID=W4VG49_9BACI|nr:formyltetrahydrofolate deformylase [Gracilibacillus boraciitolerans JCM 21714]
MKSYIVEKLETFKKLNKNRARLLISCSDQPGIVAAVSQFLYEHDANILESNQYSTDPHGGRVFYSY